MKKKRKRFLCALATVTLALLLMQSAWAISFRNVPSFQDIVEMSSLSFRGEVIGISYGEIEMENKYGGVPYTKIKIRVDECYQGCAQGKTVSVLQAGGLLQDQQIGFKISGLPKFTKGDLVAVFSNDRIHPMFGTLYADLGIRRLIEGPDGLLYLATNSWRPLIQNANGDFGTSRTLRCQPNETQRWLCDGWIGKDEDGRFRSYADPAQLWGDAMVTAEQFDAHVHDIVENMEGDRSAGPAQTVSGDEALFEKAFFDFVEGLNRPAPLR